MSKRKLLFVATRPSDYVEMRRAFTQLAKNSFCVELIYTGSGSEESNTLENIDMLFGKGTLANYYIVGNNGVFIKNRVLKTTTARVSKKPKSILFQALEFIRKAYKKNQNRFTEKMVDILYQILGYLLPIYRSIHLLYIYKHAFLGYKQIIGISAPDLMVLPEDIVGLTSPLMIKAAHSYHVPTVILPYTICNQQEAFQSLKSNSSYSVYNSLLNRIIAKLFKTWSKKRGEVNLLRLPGYHVLSHYLLGVSPPDPWMMNSGYANAIAVESEKMRQYYLDAGLPATKLRVVGAMYDDELASAVNNKEVERAKIYNQLHLTNDKPMLLIGGCPDQTKGTPPRFDFKDIEECMNFICDQIKPLQSTYHIVMRPHPNHMEIGEYFKLHGVTVTDLPTDKLIAASEIYIAHASATIRWAIACGVPVINYDVFYFNFSDYADVQGVATVNSKDEFIQAIAMLSSDKLDEMKRVIQFEKNKWAMLDGKSTERIVNLVSELCSLEKVSRTTC